MVAYRAANTPEVSAATTLGDLYDLLICGERGAVLSIIGKKYGTTHIDIPTRWLDGRLSHVACGD
jgi:hypothetical protein